MAVKASYTAGRFYWREFLGEPEDLEMMKKHGITPVRALTNEGQVSIMAGTGDDVKRVALVDCQTRYKRGEGCRTVCAERDAPPARRSRSGSLGEAVRPGME